MSETAVNEQLLRVLEKLDLRWDEGDLQRQFHPFVLGDLMAFGGVALVFEGRAAVSSASDLVIKVPRVPDPDECFVMNWATCLEAIRYEAAVLRKCAGIPGLVQLVGDRSEEALPHLVMNRLGESLDDRVGENGEHPLDLAATVRLVNELASTLRRMHEFGALHGDVSPRNVLEGPDQSWRLIDPSPPDLTTEDLGLREVSGEARDIVGLGRTFLLAYYGAYHDDLPDDEIAELEEHPELLNLVRRMLGRSRYPIPSARRVVEITARALRREFTR